jgi:small subunit ribosomal protein S1
LESNTGETMPGQDPEIKDQETEESFAALFERSSQAPGRMEPGQKVTATVVNVSGDYVYIDLGGKIEGVIPGIEFKDEQGESRVEAGQQVNAFFVTVQDGFRKFTTMVHGISAATLGALRDAYDAGLPVAGKVTGTVKGGYEVHVGKVRCFCPFSQIDLKGARDTEQYLRETYPFKVLEYEENGRNIILSRRALLEEEQAVQVKQLKESLRAGMDVTGKVRSVQRFGVFVDLGGIDGLIPLSELGWGRTENPGEVLSAGQEVTVRILSVDWEKDRLSLSLKAMQPDPWSNVTERYPVEARVSGSVARLAPFGAFVNLEPGVDGLLHISKLGAGRRVAHPKEVLEVGQWIETWVTEVDEKNRKISLSMEQKTTVEQTLPEQGEILDGFVEKVLPSGILFKTEAGAVGLIPNSEMGTPRGANHNRMFPAGSPMKAMVLEVDPDRRRITLSRSKVGERTEKDDYSSYVVKAKDEESASKGLGSFGELLKASLEKMNKEKS